MCWSLSSNLNPDFGLSEANVGVYLSELFGPDHSQSVKAEFSDILGSRCVCVCVCVCVCSSRFFYFRALIFFFFFFFFFCSGHCDEWLLPCVICGGK